MGSNPTPSESDSAATRRQRSENPPEAGGTGRDPIDERRREKAEQVLVQARSIIFDQAAEAYITANESSWRNVKHRGQWRSSLKTYASSVLGNLPVAEITTDHVLRVLKPIWTKKSETAVRVRGRIETVLASAIAQGWCLEPNVARWHNHLQMILPPRSKVAPVKPHPALDWQNLPAFMTELRGHDSFGAWTLEFTILTGARSGETRGACWDEIDLETGFGASLGCG